MEFKKNPVLYMKTTKVNFCRIAFFIALLFLTGCARVTHFFQSIAPLAVHEEGAENVEQDDVYAPKYERPKFEKIKAKELEENVGLEPGPFTVKVGDRLRVLVWGHPELAHVADVHPNGSITLPLSGELYVEGLTLPEIVAKVQSKLIKYTTYQSRALNEGDQIAFGIWGYPELQTTTIIQPGGIIHAPLIGEVQVVGRTIPEIRGEIQKRTSEYIEDPIVSMQPLVVGRKILSDPVVSVLPESTRPRRVSIIGEVTVPGQYPIESSLTVVELLAAARYLDSGALNSVIVIRDYQSEQPKYKKLKIKSFLMGRSKQNQNIYLTDRDIVIVPKRLITKVGDFVQDFVVNTAPVLQYMNAAYQAAYAKDTKEIVQRVNRLDGRAERKADIDEGELSLGSLLDQRLDISIRRTQDEE